jgi:hypothetical protein
VITAWDEMLCAKFHPGQFTTDYCAGMNRIDLPTNIFSVSNSHASCHVFNGLFSVNEVPLGQSDYTVVMWSSSMTAFRGDGYPTNIPETDKLGGMIMFQLNEDFLDDGIISRNTFLNPRAAYSMLEVYGSDMSNFSAGGYVWASEAQFNIL